MSGPQGHERCGAPGDGLLARHGFHRYRTPHGMLIALGAACEPGCPQFRQALEARPQYAAWLAQLQPPPTVVLDCVMLVLAVYWLALASLAGWLG